MSTTLSYDAITGYATDAALDEQIKSERAETMAVASEYMQMAQTAGWQRLRQHLEAQIEAGKEKLVDENDPDEIKRLQQTVRAISNVIGFVTSFVEQARVLQEEAERESA